MLLEAKCITCEKADEVTFEDRIMKLTIAIYKLIGCESFSRWLVGAHGHDSNIFAPPPLSAKVQMNSIVPAKVQLCPPPINVLTTQTAPTERQKYYS